MGIFRKLLTGLGFLTLLLVLLVAGWFLRDNIEAWLGNVGNEDIAMIVPSPEAIGPSPEAAARVEALFRELGAGEGGGETRVTETELQSYVLYRLAPRLPAGVEAPAIELRDSTVAFSAKVDFTRLTVGGDATASLGRMFGDSARIAGEVFPEVGEVGEGRLHLVSLQAGVFPVPPFVLGMAAQQLGLRTDGRTLLFDIPATVVEVRVENEEIVLLGGR